MRLARVVLLTFPLAFGPIWGGTTWLASRLGGWSVLAAHYRAPVGRGPWEGLSFRNGWMGWLGYGWALELGVEGDHLRLEVAWPFRMGHPPLAVPLEEVRITREPWVLGERARFHFAAAPGVRLRTFPGTAEELVARAGGRLRVE